MFVKGTLKITGRDGARDASARRASKMQMGEDKKSDI